VFDRGHDNLQQLRKAAGRPTIDPIRRTRADRTPARGPNVTRQLMGDPSPGRSAQDRLEAAEAHAIDPLGWRKVL